MLQLLYAKIQEIVLLPTAISERNNISKHLYNISTIFKSKTTVKYSYYGGISFVLTYHNTLSTNLTI